ncbi:MAG: hypothetical protein ACJ74D_13450 [Gaiellaceae bacterium]
MSSRPTFADAWLTPGLVLKFTLASALSLGVVLLAPRTVDSGGDVPPVRMLLVTGTIVAVICCGLLAWGLRSDLRLPWKVAIYAVVFNTVVIVVKLALAPHGFYEVNQRRDIDATFGTIDNGFMALIAAACVFALYAAVYVVLYRTFRAKIEHLGPDDPVPRLISGRNLALSVVILTVLLVASGGALLLVLLPLAGGIEYIDFVFSSGLSLIVAGLLACATAFAALAFSSTADRARMLGDASVFMSFFWAGLYFLALYHALWVVYILVLTSIWPLKVVTPK